MSCQTCNSNVTEDNTIEFDLDMNLIQSVEREYFIWNGLVQIIAQFTSDTKWKPDTERYESLLNEYMTSFIKYSVLFDGIKQSIIKENNLIASEYINAGIDFVNHKIIFYK